VFGGEVEEREVQSDVTAFGYFGPYCRRSLGPQGQGWSISLNVIVALAALVVVVTTRTERT
jgi:hypothetical protein